MEITAIDNKVKQIVSNIRNLPTPPIVFHQIQKVMNDPDVSAVQVAAILAEDPAMSVKVLKLTNSAFYGLAREVDSVKHAVVIIGLEAIKNLVLSASVLDMFKGKNVDKEFQEKHWRHSLATAFCCRILSKKLRKTGIINPDSAFSSGLLHDIGKMVMTIFLSDEYSKVQKLRQSDRDLTDFELEEKALGYNHAQIGGILATQWKLPALLAETITFHHHPHLSEHEDAIPSVVNLGDYISKKTFYEEDEAFLIGELDSRVREHLQVTDEEIEEISELLREEYLKAETFMQMVGIS